MALHHGELLAQRGNAAADVAAVRFELCLAGAARADAAAEAGEILSGAGKAGQQVAQLREFHLQLALAAAGARGENVEDQHGAVHHAHAAGVLHVADLRGAELAVEDQQIDLVGLAVRRDLLEHAGADAGGRVRRGPFLRHSAERLRPGAARELIELGERGLGVVFARIHFHEQRALRPLLPVCFLHMQLLC